MGGLHSSDPLSVARCVFASSLSRASAPCKGYGRLPPRARSPYLNAGVLLTACCPCCASPNANEGPRNHGSSQSRRGPGVRGRLLLRSILPGLKIREKNHKLSKITEVVWGSWGAAARAIRAVRGTRLHPKEHWTRPWFSSCRLGRSLPCRTTSSRTGWQQ